MITNINQLNNKFNMNTKELTTAVLLAGVVGTGNELYIIDNILTPERIKVRGYNSMIKARADVEKRLILRVKETAAKYPERLTPARVSALNNLRDIFGNKVFNF